jgi:hypothetical protein
MGARMAVSQAPEQGEAGGRGGPSTAQQIPLSGRQQQSGTVSVTQSTSGGNGSGAGLVVGSVNVQSGYTGSVPTGDNTGTVLPLRLDYALQIALRHNRVRISVCVRAAFGNRLRNPAAKRVGKCQRVV